MSAVIFNDGKFQGIGNNGQVVPYGKLYFNKCCTGEAMETFRDSILSSANTYPINLSASGKADVFLLDGTYDVTLKDKNDVTIWTINNFIPSGGDGSMIPAGYSQQFQETQTGISGNSLSLENNPISDIVVHKNGLLLSNIPSITYSLLNGVITFVDALIPSDVISVEYVGLSPTETVGVNGNVETIDDLSFVDSTKIKTIVVQDEFRGGTFVYDSDKININDGGTIFNGWVRQYDNIINVKWFGAKCDGVTDDTTPVKDALLVGEIFIPSDAIVNSVLSAVYYGKAIVYSSVGVINEKYVNVGNVASSNGDTMRTIDCAIRQNSSGSGWILIDDSGHKPNGVKSVTLSDENLVIEYDFDGAKVGSLMVTADETYSNLGVRAGASVGSSSSTIQLRKTLDAVINLSALTTAESSYFTGKTSVVNNGDGTATITHPSCSSDQINPVITEQMLGVRTVVSARNATTITVAQYAQFTGYIYYDGSNWVVSTTAKNKPTMVFSGSILTVTVDATLSGHNKVVAVNRNTPYIIQMEGTGATTFGVVFKDFNGTAISTPDTNMKFYFTSQQEVQQESVAGTIYIKRENCKLDANQVYGSIANLWIKGAMYVE